MDTDFIRLIILPIMDFDVSCTLKEETPITEEEAFCMISDFITENDDINDIYKIQIDEALAYMKARLCPGDE